MRDVSSGPPAPTVREALLARLADGQPHYLSEDRPLSGYQSLVLRHLRRDGAIRAWLGTRHRVVVQLITSPHPETCRSCRFARWATNDRGQMLWGRAGRCEQLHTAVRWPDARVSCPAWAGR